MKAKRFLSAILCICMLFTASLSGSCVSAEESTIPTITMNLSKIYSGQSVKFSFTNVESGMSFGVFPGNSKGEITAYKPTGYKALSATTTSQTVNLDSVGYYVAAIWKSGWDFVTKVPITVYQAPTISVGSTKIPTGSSVKFSFANLEDGMSFAVLPGNASGSITAYSPTLGYKALSATTTSQTITLSTAGYYVAAIWLSGWNFVAKLPITVVDGMKTASLDKTSCFEGDILTLTTNNWSLEDGDFFAIYDSSVTDITADTEAVYTSVNNPGEMSYQINTTGWQAGEYRLVAFDSGNYAADAAEYIADMTFTVKLNKKVSMDKVSYTTKDTITVTTQNWSVDGGEFIRIYKKPITGYDKDYVANTYSTVWGKSEYKFYPKNWEPGEYTLIAFDGGSNWPIINQFDFTITLPEVGPYTVETDTLKVNESTTIDFSQVVPKEIEGKLFIGWKDSEGNAVENNTTFEAGTILTAEYIDYNAENNLDFGVVETEIRSDFSTGLRFIAEQSNSLYENLPNADEYGLIVLPSEILNVNSWAELTLEGVYYYNDVEFTTEVVKADKLYETDDDSVRYSVCITDISDSKYTRQYTVRGYIKYIDINGVERILYTKYVSTNPYAVAKEELKKDNISEKTKQVAEEIISFVNNQNEEKYSSLNKITVAGTSNDLTSYVYQLGEDGIYVREAEFNLGLDKPIVITQLSDLHFNYINEKDYLEWNPTVLSTYDMRTLAKEKGHINARKVVDFARTSDAVVVTGDVIDYLSWGNIELMYKEVWDVIPDAIMSLGNHEYQQKMLGVMPETLSLENRFEILNKVWKHNINYYSKVIDDKVMIIQMNNGEDKFYEDQTEPFAADIQIARENGYAIMLFMHEPIATGNSEYISVVPILADDSDKPINFYDAQVGGAGSDQATLEIMNLIKTSPDVIKGIFNGHSHVDCYTEVSATYEDKEYNIPQYTATGNFYNNGHVTKITIK